MTFLTMFRRKSKPSTELSAFVYPHGTAEHHHSHLHHQLEVIGDKIFHLFHDQQKNKIEVKQGLKRDANEASLTNVEPAAKNETTSGEPLLFFLINNIAKSLLDLPHSQFCESNIKFEDEEKYDELDSSELNCFHAQGKHLRMDISLYINRLVKLSNKWSDDQRTGSESTGIRCAIMALFYLEKAKVVLSADSVHRYFAIAFLLSLKFSEDYSVLNSQWEIISGISVADLNRMEIAFCHQLGWELFVDSDEYNDVLRRVLEHK